MENNPIVLTSIGLTVCGAIFLFIISGIYYSGRRFPGYESAMYRLLISFCYLASFQQVLSFQAQSAGQNSPPYPPNPIRNPTAP